jgi:hypothetical protein
MLPNRALVATLICLSIAPAAASSQQRNILLDDQGRLHFNADDVMILNASFRGLINQLQALNTTLQQEIQARDQQIAELQNNGCVAAITRFNATEAALVAKLVVGDGAVNDYFGAAVAATNDMVVVGAYLDDVKGIVTGSAYVFEKNSTGQFEQVSQLMASDGATADYFGFSVAATDGVVVVGAYRNEGEVGSAYVFEKNNTRQYEQVSKLTAGDGAAGDRFGAVLATSDDMVVIAAYADDDKGTDSGSVYVFERNSTGQYEQASKLLASDGAADDYFGIALATTGSIVVVGSQYSDDKGSNSGSAYVFEKNSNGQFEQVSKLVASDGAGGDYFGHAVAATDDMMLVGAYRDDDKGSNSGSVYVFEKNSTGQYEQVSKLGASDGAADDEFGIAVAATDGMVVVGAWGKDGKAGSVYVFEKNSTGQFKQVGKLLANDGAANDYFGRALAATDGMVVIGAYGDDDKGSNSGSVYVFE